LVEEARNKAAAAKEKEETGEKEGTPSPPAAPSPLQLFSPMPYQDDSLDSLTGN